MLVIPEESIKLTWDEHIFVGGTNELHGLLGKYGHIFVGGIARNVFVSTVIERDQNIQQH